MKRPQDKFLDGIMTVLVILILVLLFRVAMNIHVKAMTFTGEIPKTEPQVFMSDTV